MLALVTCAAARALDTDLPLLVAELPEARVAVWDDPAVDWSAFDAAVIRSTWDYPPRRGEFLSWCRRVERATTLWNPSSLVAWNTDKRYLIDLTAHGIPVVPTRYVAPVDARGRTHGADDRIGRDDVRLDDDVIVKPTVGAGSKDVVRCRHDPDRARRHIDALHRDGRTAMVQPYLDGVERAGETALVYVGGEFSHACSKGPILTAPIEWEGGLFVEEQVEPHSATPDELALGDLVLAALPATAYARIDLLPCDDGPVVLEVEVTEPSLFLDRDPGAPSRAAAAFRSLTT